MVEAKTFKNHKQGAVFKQQQQQSTCSSSSGSFIIFDDTNKHHFKDNLHGGSHHYPLSDMSGLKDLSAIKESSNEEFSMCILETSSLAMPMIP